MAKDITYSNFIKHHIKKLPGEFKWQATPLQIYPLEILSNYLVLPTPLLRADFHFMVYLNKGSYQHQVGIDNYDIQSPSIFYLTNKSFTGTYRVKDRHCPEGGRKISRADLAHFIIQQIDSDEFIRRKPVLAY